MTLSNTYAVVDIESPCKPWPHYTNKDGYGQTMFQGKAVHAHRIAYCKAHHLSLEDIAGKAVLHSCDNPSCVNPNHLRLGTWGDNNRDRAAKGRSAKNVHSRRRLHPHSVRTIRRRFYGDGVTKLARRYGVDTNTIYQIVTRRTYRDID